MRRTALVVLCVVPFVSGNGPQGVYEQDLHGLAEEHLGAKGPGVPDDLLVRKGYRVDVAADDLGEARFMEVGPDGVVYLSQPRAGRIVALRDSDGDGTYDDRRTFVEVPGSNPHSMDFHGGYLWFTASEPGYLMAARDTTGDGVADDVVTVIEGDAKDGIPGGGGHAFRGVLVQPDHGRVLVMVTDPGNMTAELDSDRKKVYAYGLEGVTWDGTRREFAGGLRNTEKLRHRIAADGTVLDEVWGADHGSDWFGRTYGESQDNQFITDLNPPDEFNRIDEGGFYGHPYLMADRTPRPEFVGREDLLELAAKTVPAMWRFTAHSANNGFAFLPPESDEGLGADHAGDVFQAQHGSWNASIPVGYAVVRLLFDDATGRPYGELKIVDTHAARSLRDGMAARPVDVVVEASGAALFSCNTTRRIYRISKE